MTEYIYAICRSYYKDSNRIFDDESIIRVGTNSKPIPIQDFNIFINKHKDYTEQVVRMQVIGKIKNGVVLASIEDNQKGVKILRQVPLDDLVEHSKVIKPLK